MARLWPRLPDDAEPGQSTTFPSDSPPSEAQAARSPEAQLCATHIGSRNIETAVSFRRGVDPGRAPVALHAPMDFLPCRLLRPVLSPMPDGNPVPPLPQTPHNPAMPPRP